MDQSSSQGRFRWDLAVFILLLVLTACEMLAMLYSPPAWFSNWPHWNYHDWLSFGRDLVFPIMALIAFADMRMQRTA